jgi:hypothetical protein
MVSSPNKFYRGVVHSDPDWKHPNFRFVLVDTLKEIQDEYGEYYLDSFENKTEFLLHDHSLYPAFYGVYGSYWIDIPKSPIKICETNDLKEAIHIAQEIMGNSIVETSDDK